MVHWSKEGNIVDCEKAGILMLKHFDKHIKTKESLLLAKHILECENCREYYIALDESFETEPVDIAPVSIGINIMREVNKLDLYKKREKISILPVFWGISIVLTGILFFITLNPEFAYSLSAIKSISVFLNNIGDNFTILQQNISIAMGGVASEINGFIALAFAGLIIALLIVLHRGENRINT